MLSIAKYLIKAYKILHYAQHDKGGFVLNILLSFPPKAKRGLVDRSKDRRVHAFQPKQKRLCRNSYKAFL